jgi:hypothetical protein
VQVKDQTKTAFSVMFCCSADGKLLPPMTVYKSSRGYNYRDWGVGHPDGAEVAANPSGWFAMFEYETWFIKVFLTWLEKQKIPKE